MFRHKLNAPWINESYFVTSRRSVRTLAASGFTIVELLIVIVVIAILAVLVLSNFSNAQIQARNVARINAARAWQKQIVAYTTLNSQYPPLMIPNGHYCLGTGNPTDWDGVPSSEDCFLSANFKHPSATINNALQTIGALPQYPATTINVSNGWLAGGISVRSLDTYDPTGVNEASYPTMMYFLEGANQDCRLGPLATAGATGGNFTLSTTNNSGNLGTNVTSCRVMLPDPAEL